MTKVVLSFLGLAQSQGAELAPWHLLYSKESLGANLKRLESSYV